MRHKAKAVVMDLGLTGYGIAKCLGHEAVQVIGIHNAEWLPIAHVSRYVQQSKVLSNDNGRADGKLTVVPDEAVLQEMVSIGESLDEKAVIFTASDYFVDFCSRNADILSEYFHVPASSEHRIHEILYKFQMNKLAEAAGLSTLMSAEVSRLSGVDSIVRDFPCPAIVKPANSLQGYKDKMGIAQNNDELRRLCDAKLESCSELIIMQYVPGGVGQTVESYGMLLPDGTPYVPFVMKKIRQHPTLLVGSATLAESAWEQDIADLSRRLIEEVGLAGPVNVEFKRDLYTGIPYFIEINYRLGANVCLTEASGTNIPYMHYLSATGNPCHLPEHCIPGIRWLEEHRDWKLAESGQVTPGQLRAEYKGIKALAVYDPSDPEPFRLQTRRDPFRIVNEQEIISLSSPFMPLYHDSPKQTDTRI
ncbi:ATP-grasp domain-containing protein [Candidatus Woesearchaeota archaeon]|nr:ATP-grasp domain-containing protein [Candidatus Woesearchaeota archaeon]